MEKGGVTALVATPLLLSKPLSRGKGDGTFNTCCTTMLVTLEFVEKWSNKSGIMVIDRKEICT